MASTTMRLSFALAASLALLPGCFPGPDVGRACQRDSDCDGQCARGGRCIDQGSGIELRLSWTLAGAEASADSCRGIAGLDIRLSGDGDEIGYAPVPCELGQVYYDVLPPWLAQVEIVAFDGSGLAIASGRSELAGSGAIAIDLAFGGASPAPAGAP